MFTLEFTIFLTLVVVVAFIYHQMINRKTKRYKESILPPGSYGWPIIGETLDFVKAHKDGKPESFVLERIKKHNSKVFKTCLIGEKMVFFAGPTGNKFLFSNENKLVSLWWPRSVRRLLGNCIIASVGDQGKKLRKLLFGYFGPDALVRYVKTMDQVTQQHLISHWQGREEVMVYPTTELFAFHLACTLLMSIEDKELVSKLFAQFTCLIKGLHSIPLNIPGTRFYKSMRAGHVLRKELNNLIRQRRQAALEKDTTASSSQDLISYLLATSDEDGRFLSETEIIDNILSVIFASYDTSGTTIALTMKYLAEMPSVYEKVLNEQFNIAKQKEAGEPLNWEDIQKMKYSWNVVSEVLRLKPPASGSYREALVDFTYEGYTIPKGWKLSWSASFTHNDPSLFPDAKTFNETRFDKAAPAPFSFVPFGGGPRMCLGKEFAKPVVLTFLHHVVNMFKWNLLNPDERIIYDPLPLPVEGLPVRLQPQKYSVY